MIINLSNQFLFNNNKRPTIDGNNNVYIPGGLMNMLTIGEIVKMNIIHHPQGKNTWKSIFTHPKESPTIEK